MLRPLAALLLAPALSASTYVVDDDGGPGVDFTDIAAALPTLIQGDVLVVRAGTYGGFTLSVPVSILGDPGATVVAGIVVSGTSAGSRTCLAGLETRWIRVEQCLGAVLLEELTVKPLIPESIQIVGQITVDASADVRLRGVTVEPQVSIHARDGLRATDSRVEVVHSIVRGARGNNHNIYTQPAPPGNGGDGIHLVGTASVVVSASEVRGGGGGFKPSIALCSGCPAGSGGAGIRMGAGTSAVVTGPAYSSVVGGDFGFGEDPQDDGPPGDGIVVGAGASLRVSGAVIEPGLPEPPWTPLGVPINGPYVEAAPPDPTLTIAGPIAQQPVLFTVEGEPGSQATLRLGRQLVVQPLPGVFGDQLVVPLRNWDLGVLPASGIATFSFAIPAASPPGAVFVAQARTVAPGGAISLTNSMPLTKR
jgi:hypothetical protein